MNYIFFSFIILELFSKPDICSTKTPKTTIPIKDRVAFLKYKIEQQIRSKNIGFENSEVTVIDENVEYEDRDNQPLTPISDKDPRKKKELYKLRQIKTTPAKFIDFDNDFDTNKRNVERLKVFERVSKKKAASRVSKNKKKNKVKISDVFYRRTSRLKDIGAQKWTHCQSLITPHLTGQKHEITMPKRIAYDDVVVIRLVQLLTEDITGHSKDDIHSILYQISNLQLRLFQWDVAAIKLLLNVINSSSHNDKVKRHTFKTVKYGLKTIFKTWNLNFGSNISLLMKQTRLFRPPCILTGHMSGSTKTSRSIRYTKATPKKKRCFKNDKNKEECVIINN